MKNSLLLTTVQAQAIRDALCGMNNLCAAHFSTAVPDLGAARFQGKTHRYVAFHWSNDDEAAAGIVIHSTEAFEGVPRMSLKLGDWVETYATQGAFFKAYGIDTILS